MTKFPCIVLALAAVLLVAAARAAPLLSVDLASDTAWTAVTAQGAAPRLVPVPGQIALRTTDGPWIEYRRTVAVPKYRAHPSIARYSLDNEWAEVTRDPRIARRLVDAAVAEDPTRPLSFSQDQPPWTGEFFGSDGTHHAWALDHYHAPPPTVSQIVGVEEDFWNRNGTNKNELIECARAAILYRLRNYAVFSPWTWNNYWPNFVLGGSKNSGTVNTIWRHNDRSDGVDGWGSDIVRFVQNCYSPFACADVDMIAHHLNTEQLIFDPQRTVECQNAPQMTRQMAVFNNSLASHRLQVEWETHWDTPIGPLAASGRVPPLWLTAGEHRQFLLTLPCGGTGGQWRVLCFVVRTHVDGVVRFEENRYVFRISNPGSFP